LAVLAFLSRWNQPLVRLLLIALGKQIAMHVAATSPASLSVEDLDADSVAREREVLIEQAKASGKPA
jgi:elongation factor Ts